MLNGSLKKERGRKTAGCFGNLCFPGVLDFDAACSVFRRRLPAHSWLIASLIEPDGFRPGAGDEPEGAHDLFASAFVNHWTGQPRASRPKSSTFASADVVPCART